MVTGGKHIFAFESATSGCNIESMSVAAVHMYWLLVRFEHVISHSRRDRYECSGGPAAISTF